MKSLLLTGASGFVGSHLQPALRAAGFDLACPRAEDLDLREASSIEQIVGSKPWDVVIHLAGMAHVQECEKNPEQARLVNVSFTENLVEKLLTTSPNCHFIFPSTAQVYAAPTANEGHVVFTESRALKPQSFYAQTKLEAEEVVGSAHRGGLQATILRLFNYTHKTQAPSFFMPHIYQELLKRKQTGDKSPVPVGNLDIERELGSVRDLVRAFLEVIVKRTWDFEVFNICSGTPKNLRRLASGLAERLQVNVDFQLDPARLRSGEPRSITGSPHKIESTIGWRSQVLTESQLIDDFLKD